MAYTIKEGEKHSVTLQRYEVNLYGAFEGKYILEEMLCQNNTNDKSYRVYFRNGDDQCGRPVENLDIHNLILDNYRQWQKEKKNETNI